MKKVMIVDDNSLAAEGIEKNIDWPSLDAEVSIIEYNSRSALEYLKALRDLFAKYQKDGILTMGNHTAAYFGIL